MKKRYEKLIRDKVPEFIEGEYKVRKLSDDVMGDALMAKLLEETLEYLDSEDPLELVDIVTVVTALVEYHGLGYKNGMANWLPNEYEKKLKEKGGFEKRLFLEWVEVDE